MKIVCLIPVFALCVFGCFASPSLAQTSAQNPALGLVAKSVGGLIGSAAAAEGSSIYSGDYISTQDNGSLLIRVGSLSLELEGSSSAHIYSTPYGAIVELNRGTAIYSTPGDRQNLVIVASDVRVTPDLSTPDFGRVSIEGRCKITVYSQRGQANVQVSSESLIVEQGNAYRVRAEDEISYRDYLSPDESDYHKHHEHRSCAPFEMAKNRGPIAAGQSRFLYVASGVVGTATGIAIWKAVESPNRP